MILKVYIRRQWLPQYAINCNNNYIIGSNITGCWRHQYRSGFFITPNLMRPSFVIRGVRDLIGDARGMRHAAWSSERKCWEFCYWPLKPHDLSCIKYSSRLWSSQELSEIIAMDRHWQLVVMLRIDTSCIMSNREDLNTARINDLYSTICLDTGLAHW